MQVAIHHDFVCPWCYIGSHRFHRAVAAAGLGGNVEVVHRPYLLDADAPDEPRPLLDAMIDVFDRERWDTMASQMTALGARDGVEFRFDRVMGVSSWERTQDLLITDDDLSGSQFPVA